MQVLPAEPADPEVPENPENPEEPQNPQNPSNPEQPTDPTDPSEPVDPTEPAEPEPPVHRHTIVTKVIQPTFLREGSVKQVCSECGEVISEKVLPKLTPKVVAVAVYRTVVTVIRWLCKLFG